MSAARTAQDPATAWRHLERAHVVSQPWAWPHACNHAAMLTHALRQRDRRESLGQLLRLFLATPGSLTGRYPEGNTGRANVGLTEPVAMPADIADVLAA